MVRRIRSWSVVLTAALSLSAFAADASAMDKAKHDHIKTLLQVTGALNQSQMVLNTILPQMVGLIQKANPNIPQAALDEITKEMKEEFAKALPELEEPTIAVYDANFTDDEIVKITEFDKSPAGQKLIAQQPQMLQQSMAIGRVWGQTVGQRVAARLRETLQKKGYKL